jgi:hypothetical protein
MLPLALIFILILLRSLVNGGPQVKLGNTTLIGTDAPILNQEFFGGKTNISCIVIFIMMVLD